MNKNMVMAIFLCSILKQSYAADPQTTAYFKVSAKIENGCSIDNVEQHIDFGKYSSLSQEKVTSNITNSSSNWNIKCTKDLPVSVSINGGENLNNNMRYMKNNNVNEYIPYRLYSKSDLISEYLIDHNYSLIADVTEDFVFNFSVYSIADLDNGGQARATGIYKDTVSILITW